MLNAPKLKGRPPLEPRIVELEAKVKALQDLVQNLGNRQINPHRFDGYIPAFDRWPGNER